MAMTTSKTGYRAGYQPLPSGVFVAPFPYPFREGGSEAEAVEGALAGLDLLLAAQTAPVETGAIVIEPVLGEGGYIPAPAAFLRGAAGPLRRARDALRRRRGAVGLRSGRRDVRDRGRRGAARRRGDGEGHRVRVPDLRDRLVGRAHGPLAHRLARRHLRRQPDRLRRRARDDRRAHRRRLHGRRQRAWRAAARGSARPPRRPPRAVRRARSRPHGRVRAGDRLTASPTRRASRPWPRTAATRAGCC